MSLRHPLGWKEVLPYKCKIQRWLGITAILERMDEIMDELQALKDAVAAGNTVEGSAITLLTELTAKINALLQNATDLATLKTGIKEVTDSVTANAAELADAVTANTPAAPNQ